MLPEGSPARSKTMATIDLIGTSPTFRALLTEVARVAPLVDREAVKLPGSVNSTYSKSEIVPPISVNGSHERKSRPGRTGRSRRPERGRVSKMFDANVLDHYWGTSVARFKEKNDVDI
jgi:hypothetical protein